MSIIDTLVNYEIILFIFVICGTIGTIIWTRKVRRKYKTEVLDYYKEQHSKKTLPKDLNERPNDREVKS